MIIAAILGLTLGVLGLAVLEGRKAFQSLVTGEVRRLFADSAASPGPEQMAARWDLLPEPARRYLRYAVPKDAPSTQTARLKHNGFLRTSPNASWLPLDGEEYFTVGKPGFVWNAVARPAPLLWIEARDRLLAGRGDMLVKFCSTFTIAKASGEEIDQGARLRWLAEAVWFPYGFIGDQIQWEPIDERSAQATLLEDGLPVKAIFDVDEEGKLDSIRADRFREVGGGRTALTPWIGRCADYREFNGFRAPSSIEVSWVLEGREFNYVRFRVKTLEYNSPERF